MTHQRIDQIDKILNNKRDLTKEEKAILEEHIKECEKRDREAVLRNFQEDLKGVFKDAKP